MRRRWHRPARLLHLRGPAHVLTAPVPVLWGEWAEVTVSKTVRITLNITPEEYRELISWADSAAAVLGVPRVSQQDALRAVLRGALDNQTATNAAVKALRNERQRSTTG